MHTSLRIIRGALSCLLVGQGYRVLCWLFLPVTLVLLLSTGTVIVVHGMVHVTPMHHPTIIPPVDGSTGNLVIGLSVFRVLPSLGASLSLLDVAFHAEIHLVLFACFQPTP